MQSDPKFIHQRDDSIRNTPDVFTGDHSHDHSHGRGHAHGHDHGSVHDHAHPHAHTLPPIGSQTASRLQRDLISPVLSGVWQRVWWSSLFLGALWLLVFWALHSNG